MGTHTSGLSWDFIPWHIRVLSVCLGKVTDKREGEGDRNLNKCRLSRRHYFIFTSGISRCSRAEKSTKNDVSVRSTDKLIVHSAEPSS